MLYNKVDSTRYVEIFKDKFSNFAQKAPTLISFVTTKDGVILVHENTGSQYEFPWDFTVPVKSFIYEIKQHLVKYHYPRLELEEIHSIKMTEDEIVQKLSEGKSVPDNGMKTISEIHKFRIDKIITLKDIFILVNEETEKIYRYKMKSSSIFYLKRYRSGQFADLREAGKDFFDRCELLGEIIPSWEEIKMTKHGPL